MLHVVVDLGRAQQCFGRDAAPIQADAAEIRFLDDRGLEAELRGADRGDVAAGAGADDDDVEGCVGHGGSHSTQTIAPRARRFETINLVSHSTAQIETRIASRMKASGWAMLRTSPSPLKNAS